MTCGKYCTALQMGISKILILLGILKTQQSTSTYSVYLRESNIRSPYFGCARNKLQYHSFTESEVIFLDAGLRMDGLPALDLWDLVMKVLHSSSIQPRARDTLLRDEHCENIPTKERRHSLTRRKILAGQSVDYVTSNAKIFRFDALLYILRTTKQRPR